MQAAINAALGQLPANLPTKPNWRKVNPADAPIMILSLTSDTISKPRMYDVADSILAQKLSQVQGIGQVFVGGGAQPAVRVEINPTLLNKLGVGWNRCAAALGAANANTPERRFWPMAPMPGRSLTMIRYSTRLTTSTSSWRRNGTGIVRLTDVADVQDSVEDMRNTGVADGKPAVLMIVFRQPGANIIDAVDRVKELIPESASVDSASHQA